MIAVLFAALVAVPLPCGPLDLPTALSLASVRSDEVAIKHGELLAAEADRAIARAAGILPSSTATFVMGVVPSAHGNILESTNSNRGLQDPGLFGRLEVNLVQPLWTWGQLTAAKNAAQAGVLGKQLLVQDTEHQVQLRMVQLYWATALARKLLQLAEEVEGALRDVEKKMAESLAAADGQVTQEDKFRVAVFRAELEQRRGEARKGLQLARIGLAATLAIDEPDLVLKDEALPSQPDLKSPDRQAAIREAEVSRPDLLALDQAMAALEAQAQASRAAELPQIFAAGTFAYSRAPNRDIQTNPWINDPFNTLTIGAVVGLRQNLAIPTLLAQASKAEADLANARRQRQGLARLVSVQTEQAVAELNAAVEKAKATQAGVTAGRSWFRTAGLNFGIGVTDARGLIEAYTGYIKTQLDSAQTVYDLLLARSRLDQVTGRALSKGASTCVLR
jgi:outer membrane protein TolC